MEVYELNLKKHGYFHDEKYGYLYAVYIQGDGWIVMEISENGSSRLMVSMRIKFPYYFPF